MSAKKTSPMARKARTPAPACESKRDKFLRLGAARMAKAIKAIKALGNLSGSGYEYTKEDVDKMSAALDGAVEGSLNRFDKTKTHEKEAEFSF